MKLPAGAARDYLFALWTAVQQLGADELIDCASVDDLALAVIERHPEPSVKAWVRSELMRLPSRPPEVLTMIRGLLRYVQHDQRCRSRYGSLCTCGLTIVQLAAQRLVGDVEDER